MINDIIVDLLFFAIFTLMFEDTYKTIETQSKSIFRDRASKFIALAKPVLNELEAKQYLAEIKKEYWDANHHCFAYLLGFDKSGFRFNDDGEPSGTAGRPIFGQIQSKDLTNIIVVVVRYFGGTKLGVSGLINAYKTAAREALEAATIIELTVNDVYEVKFTYQQMNNVMKLLKDEHLEQGNHHFDLECFLEFKVRRKESKRIYDLFSKIQGLKITFLQTE